MDREPRQICHYYVSGGCSRGDGCPYSHELVVQAPEGSEGAKIVIQGNVANAGKINTPTLPDGGGFGEGGFPAGGMAGYDEGMQYDPNTGQYYYAMQQQGVGDYHGNGGGVRNGSWGMEQQGMGNVMYMQQQQQQQPQRTSPVPGAMYGGPFSVNAQPFTPHNQPMGTMRPQAIPPQSSYLGVMDSRGSQGKPDQNGTAQQAPYVLLQTPNNGNLSASAVPFQVIQPQQYYIQQPAEYPPQQYGGQPQGTASPLHFGQDPRNSQQQLYNQQRSIPLPVEYAEGVAGGSNNPYDARQGPAPSEDYGRQGAINGEASHQQGGQPVSYLIKLLGSKGAANAPQQSTESSLTAAGAQQRLASAAGKSTAGPPPGQPPSPPQPPNPTQIGSAYGTGPAADLNASGIRLMGPNILSDLKRLTEGSPASSPNASSSSQPQQQHSPAVAPSKSNNASARQGNSNPLPKGMIAVTAGQRSGGGGRGGYH